MRDLLSLRLANQHLAKATLSPAAVVAALGAMQAQDYAGGKWAVGLRSGAGDVEIEAAITRW